MNDGKSNYVVRISAMMKIIVSRGGHSLPFILAAFFLDICPDPTLYGCTEKSQDARINRLLTTETLTERPRNGMTRPRPVSLRASFRYTPRFVTRYPIPHVQLLSVLQF